MRAQRHLIFALAGLCFIATPAQACIVVALGGSLALQSDFSAISSEGTLGSTITVSTTLLDGSFTITIDPPTLDDYPPGFPAGTAVVQQRTSSPISTIDMNFGYTSGMIRKTFPVNVLDAAVITLHHRITASKYPQGHYRTKTVVTCS